MAGEAATMSINRAAAVGMMSVQQVRDLAISDLEHVRTKEYMQELQSPVSDSDRGSMYGQGDGDVVEMARRSSVTLTSGIRPGSPG